MLAIIKTGGKQYIVKPGDKLKVEKLDPIGKTSSSNGENSEIIFEDILLLEKNNKLEIGAPFVKGAKVEAKILRHGKGDKIIVFKYKPKKRYSRKIGHRQPYTEIEIMGIKN
ncbi:MAG: 50S ribosomal protein L21 [Candidatus Staskawiczbacteria bacterium RIFOXYC1_FULL_37_43]|nr:MAG: 50S ribosomal protein L21 [Candidatus Staskawiczbacteria bacterium RIFCSPHIGHO2_01_FULL_37_17]OGZ71261.1 MAG: 50S ribosomal protein L21 [Candidatus Staskawiczbacteria bacterium RIFCSPLOWO2_01_FULL_37_19]OGZ75599.1 MAG: 50S ribosomal protein L21 [Candidatus Staskawiczbacteria bacterium RIFOXYA1_FULL_37_15]OGZ76624.1 MAG: 50S ribosomal protein L21 [Candidatus Staskawiczbacteria bacterium RIFOXYA12_FULL_37_10]OGZ79875.1 MAG: 50S ribosomal protein L21 [Candidatus Staskawiczbacteria bacteriu